MRLLLILSETLPETVGSASKSDSRQHSILPLSLRYWSKSFTMAVRVLSTGVCDHDPDTEFNVPVVTRSVKFTRELSYVCISMVKMDNDEPIQGATKSG